jgi:hypothetical protein
MVIGTTSSAGNQKDKIPNFSPETFKNVKNDSQVLAAYGKMPSFENTEQRQDWLNLLQNVSDGVRDNPDFNFSEYTSPNGPIVGYGYDINGYLFVTVDKDLEKTRMDHIYGMFDQQAKVNGVEEVPLVFNRGEVPHLDLLSEEESSTNYENSTNQQTETNQSRSKEKSNSTPGFSTIFGLFGLYITYRIRH